MGPVMGDYIHHRMEEPSTEHRSLVGTAFRHKILAGGGGLVQRVVAS